MKKNALASVGVCICTVVPVVSLLWEVSIVNSLWGFWVAFLALLLFPGTLALVPWYMLFVYGNWQLLIFSYGGCLLGGFIFSIGDDSSDEHTETIRLACEVETEASVSHTQPSAISDYRKRVEVKPKNAKAHDNSRIALAKNRRILVIDDNPNIHTVWPQLLEEVDANNDNEAVLPPLGASPDSAREVVFEIDSARQGQEGLQKIRQAFQEGRPYVVALVDVRMPPGWDGVTTIERIWKEYPDLPAVIYAPYSDYSAPEIVDILGRSEKLLILKNPPDNEAIHQFAVDLTKEWECNQATRFERLLKQAAKQPLANICDPDWIRKLAENGDSHSMLLLANLYLGGDRGFQQDRCQAISWLREAARLGNEDAKDRLVEIGEMVVTSGESAK